MSSIVTGLKCAFCGKEILRIMYWEELPHHHYDFCNYRCRREGAKVGIGVRDAEEALTSAIGRGNYCPTPPAVCKGKGISNCLECPLGDCTWRGW